MSDELKKAAEEAKNAAMEKFKEEQTNEEPAKNHESEEKKPEVNDDDDDFVVDYGFNSAPSKTSQDDEKKEEAEKVDLGPDMPSMDNLDLTDEDLKSFLPTENDGGLTEFGPGLVVELNKYTKDLLIQYGLKPEEAAKARDARARKRIIEEQEAYFKDHPDVATVEVHKGNEEALGLTEEEHEKLHRAKKIHLITVEDMDLKTLKILTVPPENKTNYLSNLQGVISQDNIPLPTACDYATFKGLQIFQLMEAIQKEDENEDEAIARKAAVIYSAFMGSSRLKKFDDNGEVILSFSDFLDKFYFYDVELALYSILCASSKETTVANLRCPNCRRFFNKEYNVRDILNFDDLTDAYKQKIDKILEYRTNVSELEKLDDDLMTGLRVKSPFSNNIYDLRSPSLAKQINVAQNLGKEASEMQKKFSILASFVNSMHVWNPKEQGYIEVLPSEHELLYMELSKIPQEDVDAILSIIGDHIYYPRFRTTATCDIDDKCNYNMNVEFDIEQWLFIRGRDTPVAIV